MPLSDRFIAACKRFRLSWDHLGAFLAVSFLLVKPAMVTWTGGPPVGKDTVPPLCSTPWSLKIDFRLEAITFPLDFLDVDFTILARFPLISDFVQMCLFPLASSVKHCLHNLMVSDCAEVAAWMMGTGGRSGKSRAWNWTGRAAYPPAPDPGGLFILAT